jgi:starch phosphorylase
MSATHTAIMRETLFRDFDKLWPEKIINLTNGISPRRWLTIANPDLESLIHTRLGAGWAGDFMQLHGLEPFAADPDFCAAFNAVKLRNKQRLARYLASELGITVDPHSMFDLHVKRIHEYKRQLLNVLHVIGRYNRIRAGDKAGLVPRTIIFSGKAAPGYVMAKRIIHLITCVADIVNNDPAIGDLLKIVFVPNYDVTLAEILIPAGDLSEQISTAGTEASGTGNMKLALNGALTIATKDGANNEIADAVGRDHIWMFGNTFEELQAIRQQGYNPRAIYEATADVRQSLDMINSGYFSAHDRTMFSPIYDSIVNSDTYMLLADYDAYLSAQKLVDLAYLDQEQWIKKAIINVSRMAPFSADRLVGEYASNVWNAKPVPKL